MRDYNVFLDSHITNHDVYLRGNKKEFDVYLSDRLTECDIIVFNIPYRDGLTAYSSIVLNACLNYYILHKFIAAQAGSSLVSRIDSMIAVISQRLRTGMQLSCNADVAVQYFLPRVETLMPINTTADIISKDVFQAEDIIQISSMVIDALVSKSLGHGICSLQIQSSIEDTIKHSFEHPTAPINISSEVSTNKKIFEQHYDRMLINTNVSNLCYNLHIAGETALHITSAVIDTELHYPFGQACSEFNISTGVVEGGIQHQNMICLTNGIAVLNKLTLDAITYFGVQSSQIDLSQEVSTVLKRFRKLYEIDDSHLGSINDLPLHELDYIMIQ